MPKVTAIPATKDRFTARPAVYTAKRRVAGYARVSTDSDEQFTSYEAQIDYYTDYIKRRADWEFAGVYTDEGISATNTRHRDGFNSMVADALAGRIDLIITKSVSRFARNTVDSLSTIRKLKERGVEVYFEKENIYTFDGKGELLLTIMSSLAQEESRSISENVSWGLRKRFADGKVSMPYSCFLGYDRGEDGTPVVNKEEAAVVRLIYRLFLEGKTTTGICHCLDERGIPTPSGRRKWSQTTVGSILSNEKYKGDALLQKRFTTDFLTKKVKANEGELPQYYVAQSHEAIIDPQEWDIVQSEIARRRKLGRSYSGGSVFSSKLVCGDCGGFYGRKIWHSTDSCRKAVWQCNSKFKGDKKCATPHLSVETIQMKFLIAYNRLMENRDSIVSDCELMRRMLSDSAAQDEELRRLEDEARTIDGQIRACIGGNASGALSQEEYEKMYTALTERAEKAAHRMDELRAERTRKQSRSRELLAFIETLKKQPLVLGKWNERLWIMLVDRVTCFRDGRMVFEFRNGAQIEVES